MVRFSVCQTVVKTVSLAATGQSGLCVETEDMLSAYLGPLYNLFPYFCLQEAGNAK